VGVGAVTDPINPDHYRRGPVEAIDVIEAAVADAPHMVPAYLQGQVLKYLLRLWLQGQCASRCKEGPLVSRAIDCQTGGMMNLPSLNLLERWAMHLLIRSPRVTLLVVKEFTSSESSAPLIRVIRLRCL
jgi:hypothetical protein